MSKKERLLLVDGYNVLGAWPSASKGRSMDEARNFLIHQLQDYAGFTGQRVIVVFDAWQGERLSRSQETRGALTVVFTQKGELADHYIERTCDELARRIELGRLEVRVATSDALEQTVVMARGAIRLSARELIYEIGQSQKGTAPYAQQKVKSGRATIYDHLPAETRERLKKWIAEGKDGGNQFTE